MSGQISVVGTSDVILRQRLLHLAFGRCRVLVRKGIIVLVHHISRKTLERQTPLCAKSRVWFVPLKWKQIDLIVLGHMSECIAMQWWSCKWNWHLLFVGQGKLKSRVSRKQRIPSNYLDMKTQISVFNENNFFSRNWIQISNLRSILIRILISYIFKILISANRNIGEMRLKLNLKKNVNS